MYDIEEFLAAYIEAALWSTSGETPEGEELESLEGYELAPETEERMRADCERFLQECGSVLESATHKQGDECTIDYAQAGHDFWLTREGHGAGFWDGDWSEPEAQTLTDVSKRFGEVYLYIGDDGLVYQG